MKSFPTATVLMAIGMATVAMISEARCEDSTRELLARANAAIEAGESQTAVRHLTQLIEADAELPTAYYLRGREHFRLAKFDQSLADFNKYVQLRPDLKSRQWERGITCYYARQFQEGADQFALYQTFHDSDVENSVWRFLCMVPLVGVDKARQQLLPIKNDPRVPMMAIYEMYRGSQTPDDVLKAARAGEPNEPQLAGRLFYAHLYIGLYHEAMGDQLAAREHITKAADEHHETKTVNRYMWDVARVHAERMRSSVEKK